MEYYFPGSETEIRRRDMNTQCSFDMLSLYVSTNAGDLWGLSRMCCCLNYIIFFLGISREIRFECINNAQMFAANSGFQQRFRS